MDGDGSVPAMGRGCWMAIVVLAAACGRREILVSRPAPSLPPEAVAAATSAPVLPGERPTGDETGKIATEAEARPRCVDEDYVLQGVESAIEDCMGQKLEGVFEVRLELSGEATIRRVDRRGPPARWSGWRCGDARLVPPDRSPTAACVLRVAFRPRRAGE